MSLILGLLIKFFFALLLFILKYIFQQ